MSRFDGDRSSHRFWFEVYDRDELDQYGVSFDYWQANSGEGFIADAVWSSGKWTVGPPELWVTSN
jgi:hypothetical protein